MRARRIALHESGQEGTGTGTGDEFSVKDLTMLMVGVSLTDYNGTAGFTCWLEGSTDGGDTWFDLAGKRSGSPDLEVPGSQVFDRDIMDDQTTLVNDKVTIIDHLPADRIRLRWVVNGTDATFACNAVGR